MQDPTLSLPEAPNDEDASALSHVHRRQGKGLTHELVEALRTQLRSRRIKPGDKLPTESVIMQSFGVSRGVVREALSRLQAAGLVQTHHGVGTFALEPATQNQFPFDLSGAGDISDMLEMLELRTSIESEAAGLAATRRTDEHLQEMRSALHDFELNLTAVGETVAPDFRFHLAIAQATGNRYFSELMGHLGLEVIPRTRVSSAWLNVEQRAQHLHKVNQEHLDIFAAIERRDPEAARAAMRIHLVNSRERQRRAHAEPAQAGDR
jgi:GntR family transcriptional regulator, transcriptional repressor for pyruvate dehydrogenase complex